MELTAGLEDEQAKIKALYQFVSLDFRYIGLDFGIGRYQPHTAQEVLANKYGGCKDKHTLLAALLAAVGIQAYPALINSRSKVDPYAQQKKDYALAVPALEKALATEGDNFNDEQEIRNFLAEGYFKIKQPDKAVEQVKKMVKAAPIPSTWNDAAHTLADNSYDLATSDGSAATVACSCGDLLCSLALFQLLQHLSAELRDVAGA